MLFAYLGPEVTLPLASVLAAAFGFIMMVGRAPFRYAARGFRAVGNWWRSTFKKIDL